MQEEIKRTRGSDVGDVTRKYLAGNRLAFLGSFMDQPPQLGHPEIAFAGRSNVGKSSAINRLLKSNKAARVSKTPGRTQAINLFEVEERCVFADLPGYGFAKVPEEVKRHWHGMIEGYLSDREVLRLVVVLVDIRREPQKLDADMIWWVRQARIPLLILATKMDKLSRNHAASSVAKIRKAFSLKASECIPFSAHNGRGLDEAWVVLNQAIAGELKG
jgi:GTP-binding protein